MIIKIIALIFLAITVAYVSYSLWWILFHRDGIFKMTIKPRK